MLASFAACIGVPSPSTGSAATLQAGSGELVGFRTSYNLSNVTYEVRGFSPGSGQYPLYIYAGGVTDLVTENYATLEFARQMASRGFLAANIETPGMITLIHTIRSAAEAGREVALSCSGGNTSLEANARALFSYGGAGDDSSPGALATLCRLPNADCAAGIALHGMSLGGLLALLAPRYATPRITAALVMSAGNIVPYGNSCCGRFSANFSCCQPGSVVGGDNLECLLDGAVSPNLDRGRRRMVIASADSLYGDCEYDVGGALDAGDYSAGASCNVRSEHGGIAQCARGSGYDCGADERECIQADGSGYVVPTSAEGHSFHMGGLTLNTTFVDTSEAWGMRPSLDWLARTARALLDSMPLLDKERGLLLLLQDPQAYQLEKCLLTFLI